MNRAEQEAREDALWSAVQQIWPQAMTYETNTPFDSQQPARRRSPWRPSLRRRKAGRL